MTSIAALHGQLKDVQGVLQTREQEFRQLKKEFIETTHAYSEMKLEYQKCTQELEAKISALENRGNAENLSQPATPATPANRSLSLDGSLSLTPSQRWNAEHRYEQVMGELAKARQQSDFFQDRLTLYKAPSDLDDEITACFKTLALEIHHIAHRYFNRSFDQALIDQKKALFSGIVDDCNEYLMNETLAPCLFQRLIWGYFDSHLFRSPDVIWGEDTHYAIKHLTESMSHSSVKISSAPFWKPPLVNALRQACCRDESFIDDVSTEVFDILCNFLSDEEDSLLFKSIIEDIKEAVSIAARLTSMMAFQDHKVVVSEFSDHAIKGMNVDGAWMNVLFQFRSGRVVELVVTPALLAADGCYPPLVKSQVLT